MNSRVESFVSKRIKYRSLSQQTLIAFVASIVFAFDMGTVYLYLGETRPKYGGVALVLVFLFVLVPFLVWFLFTLSFYLIGLLFGARVQFSVLLRAVGYGMVPFIGAGLAWGVGRYIALASKAPCEIAAFNCKTGVTVGIQDQVNALIAMYSSVSSSLTFQILYVVGVAFVLVSGYYWVIALKESSTLTREGAAIAVGLTLTTFLSIITLQTF